VESSNFLRQQSEPCGSQRFHMARHLKPSTQTIEEHHWCFEPLPPPASMRRGFVRRVPDLQTDF
jgi:hypothetical protein